MRYLQKIVILILLLFSLFWIPLTEKKNTLQPSTIIQAFNTCEAQIIKTSILSKGVIQSERVAKSHENIVEQLTKIAEDVLEKYEEPYLYARRETNTSDYYTEYRISAETVSEEYLTINVWCEKQTVTDLFKSYITVELFKDKPFVEFENIKTKIKKILDLYASDVQFTETIVGTYSGKMNDSQINQFSSEVFNHSNKKDIKYTSQPKSVEVLSHTATNQISVIKDGMKLSLNYNPYDDKTYIIYMSQ